MSICTKRGSGIAADKAEKGSCPKITVWLGGFYRVVQKLTDLVYRIKRGPQSETKVVHHNLLKPYIQDI